MVETPDTDRIRNLATPKEPEPDAGESARLETLTSADVEQEGLGGAGCAFESGGQLLLVAAGSDSIVRIGGRLVHLIHSSPMGPSGGFFEDRQLSVSVGRTGEATPVGPEARVWPARATVTNRRTEAQVDLTGTWTCGA